MTSPKRRVADLYGGLDPRDTAAYSIQDAARYLRMPPSTLAAWSFGQRARGRQDYQSVLVARHRDARMLSFKNIVGAHILSALRTHYGMPMPRIRAAIEFLRAQTGLEEPLVDSKFLTDGADIFVECVEGIINASQHGQMAIRPVLQEYFRRIEYDRTGVVRLFPFVRVRESEVAAPRKGEPRFIVMDPLVAFGKPVIAGTSVRTAAIADRYMAGESIEELADDYARSREEIEEAIRCESAAA